MTAPFGWPAALFVAVVFVVTATAAKAQDDGPRVYQFTPVGTKNVTAFAVAKRGNEAPEGDVIPGSSIDTDILVFRYAQTFDVGGRLFNPFVIVPTGRVRSTVHDPGGDIVSKSSGFGDAQIGAVIGLLGSPALAPDQLAGFRPAVSTGLMVRGFFPTGAYSSRKPVNFGSNRYALQLGLPTGIIFGQSYLDRRLTTLEVLPTITFYEVNDRPFGAAEVAKEPQFAVESHLTHTLGPRQWLSADVLYRRGGETVTDGQSDRNPIDGWSAGVTWALKVAPSAVVALTYQHVVERRDDGPDGWFFRSALIVPFR